MWNYRRASMRSKPGGVRHNIIDWNAPMRLNFRTVPAELRSINVNFVCL